MLTLLNIRLLSYNCDQHNCPLEFYILKLLTFRLASLLWFSQRYRDDAGRLG
jgi:hypothetical protein